MSQLSRSVPLKGCAFCDVAPITFKDDRYHVIMCDNNLCPVNVTAEGITFEEATEHWNRRVTPPSEKQAPITDNDRRWRFLEHGCQWVSFTPIGGDTRSFDPRIVSGYAGHLGDMRATVDREAEKQLAILNEGINATKR